jgi:hypothetical protein
MMPIHDKLYNDSVKLKNAKTELFNRVQTAECSFKPNLESWEGGFKNTRERKFSPQIMEVTEFYRL